MRSNLTSVCITGLAWLDIVDNWTNQINLIIIGILECIAVGWLFDLHKVHNEVNRNTKKFKAPYWWLVGSIKIVSPLLLAGLFIWNMIDLFGNKGGSYGGYPIWAQICAGWIVSCLVFASGIIARIVINKKKEKGFEEDEIFWDAPAPESLGTTLKKEALKANQQNRSKKKSKKRR